jgi:tetratricopeptide (TPR) repeat protein
MKNFAIIFLLFIFSLTAFAQKPAKKTSPTSPVAESTPLDEDQEFQNARAQTSIADRIAALKKFTEDFPESDKKIFALELIVSSRAELGDQKLRLSDNQNGIELFKLAVAEAPTPISDKLYAEIILQLPTNLFYRGQREAAFEIARSIEEKTDGNAGQMLGLAAFYLGTESASDAKRVAEKVIAIQPESAAAYQTLGLANRINFDLEASTAAYTKALELNPDSLVSKRSLAEMKRATAKPDEAAALYREILEKDPTDTAAQTGLVMSLFNSDKKTEAEGEMAKALESNSSNLFLLVGAAYWYAAHNQGAKAVELAEKAVAYEPRYTWAHIALARGLIQQNRPLEAEKTLLMARQYGNFPTLNYEIAAARMAAGFYREAANELEKTFSVKDGIITANLGNRIPKEGKSFIEVLSPERRASIFEPVAADDPVTAEKLKSLLKFSRKINSSEPNETEIAEAADEFVKGEDKMKLHRGLYVANRLLEKRIALPKALELAEAAVGKVETGLDVSSPSAAVLADELYETRTIAATRNELLVIPDIPRQTLSRILRGRIEELTGWAFLQEGKPDEAAVRFKRAISILPEKSAWWRSSKWRLGDALETSGKSKEALNAYIESYNKDEPNPAKFIVIESIYQKVNGGTDGLEQIIGVKPTFNVQETAKIEKPLETPTPEPTVQPTPVFTQKVKEIPTNVPVAKQESKTETPVQSEVKPTPTPDAATLEIPENIPTIKSESETKKDEEETKTLSIAGEKNEEKTEIPPVSPILLKTEPTPEPQVVSEVKTTPTPEEVEIPENVPTVSSTPAPTPETQTISETPQTTENNSEKQSEPKQSENTDKPVKNPNSDKTQNSLFEPIVINVPKVEKKAKTEKQPENKEEKVENKSVEPKTEESPPEKKSENPSSRPRIVTEVKTETIAETENILQCALKISPNSISILNDGGSLGMFVGFEGKGGDLKQLTVKSSNPKDVNVEFQPDIGLLTERAFFIIKSISSKTGIFTVSFESNCGKKDISVTVR